MPTYEYRCKACSKAFTLTKTWKEFDKSGRPKCPKCGKTRTRQVYAGFTAKTSKKS